MTQLLPSEVLSRAADLIEPEGAWGQQGQPKTDCAHCAMTAIWHHRGGPRASAFLYRVLGVGTDCAVFNWNDASGRTQADVVAALRAASELAKSEAQ